jgi:hypothetical protein
LIIDDFMDGDLRPYFGLSWGSYTERNDGKNGLSSIKKMEIGDDGGKSALYWAYRLDGSQQIGFNPYAALEWTCATGEGVFSLVGLDTLVFNARAASTLEVSVQFITSDIGDYTYFEDSVTLETSMKEYRLPVSEFKQRLNGGGRELDLSKCTSIRFQVQDVDGTENEIVMRSMLVSGEPALLYMSPPDYIPPEPGIGAITAPRARTGKLQCVITDRLVRFTLPFTHAPMVVTIFTADGRRVDSLPVSAGGHAVWKYTDHRGNKVGPGVYYAVTGQGATRFSKTIYRLP